MLEQFEEYKMKIVEFIVNIPLYSLRVELFGHAIRGHCLMPRNTCQRVELPIWQRSIPAL